MNCREGCGACCIAPSISSPLPGMPQGKPAGERCLHLSVEQLCLLFGQPERPAEQQAQKVINLSRSTFCAKRPAATQPTR